MFHLDPQSFVLFGVVSLYLPKCYLWMPILSWVSGIKQMKWDDNKESW